MVFWVLHQKCSGQELGFGALLYQFSLQAEGTADVCILKLTYKAIKFPHLNCLLWVFLSLSSPLPVYNFLMNFCWQPPHFTSSWQGKQTLSLRADVDAQADQNMYNVMQQPSQLLFALLSALPNIFKTAFLRKAGQVIQSWTSHMETVYNTLCQIICYVPNERVVLQDVGLFQHEFRQQCCFLHLPITL